LLTPETAVACLIALMTPQWLQDDHQAASLHDTTRRMLIAMAVGDHVSAPLNLAEVIGGRRLDVAAAR
jgi:hypothetical protein